MNRRISVERVVAFIKRMRNKDSLKLIEDTAKGRIRKTEAQERWEKRAKRIAKDPRYALDIDNKDHPRWDGEKETNRKYGGWPGPGWVWSRRGEWRKLGDYDG
jgi:hypothetical protein